MARPSKAPHHTMTNSPRNHGKAGNAMRKDGRPPTTATTPHCGPAASPCRKPPLPGSAACRLPRLYHTCLQSWRFNANRTSSFRNLRIYSSITSQSVYSVQNFSQNCLFFLRCLSGRTKITPCFARVIAT